MPTQQISTFMQRLRSVLVRQDAVGLADDELLDLYLRKRGFVRQAALTLAGLGYED
jgi:hypothetical protein